MNSSEVGAAGSISTGGKQMLFRTAGERYGIDILRVREIIGLQTLVRVPCCPPSVEGVIDLRGQAVPVLNLRSRFGLSQARGIENPCIIVLALTDAAQPAAVGIMVDEVDGVQDIDSKLVEPPPSVGVVSFERFLKGVARVDGDVVMLLDVEEILGRADVQSLMGATESR